MWFCHDRFVASTRRLLTPTTKRHIWRGLRQPSAQCVACWLDQGLRTTAREEILSLVKVYYIYENLLIW